MACLRRKGRLETLLMAAMSAPILYVGCLEEPPTQVSNDPAQVVRGYTDHRACWTTEVMTASSESTDTVLATFNSTMDPEATSCYPNLAQWGIDIADPIGVDTPQGNGYFRIETAYPISNMPTPPHAALGGNYTPAQVVIEFDPPVRSVHFFYSRRAGSRAWWNGVEQVTESTLVQARSRTPGTLQYQLHASKVLHTNSSGAGWDGWDSVALTSFTGDKIQWLSIFGTLAIDNLTIVRKPLTCTPTSVQRGQQVTCTVTLASDWSVTRWEFIPDGSAGVASAPLDHVRATGTEDMIVASNGATSSLPVVVENTSSKVWVGGVSIGGLVKVHVANGSAQRSYETTFTVTDRPSNWESQWSFREGPEQTVADREVKSAGEAFGRNCPEQFAQEADCTAAVRSRVQPDPHLEPGAGYTPAMFPSGPNNGYWYVQSIRYDMRRVANVHPGMLVTSPRTHPVPVEVLTKKCKQGLGLHPKATTGFANMNQFNQFCAPTNALGTDMTVFVPAIWGHEGFGYNGGIGHETLGRQAAGEPQNNPYKAIENLTAPDSISLAETVNQRVAAIADDISIKARDDNPINGGPRNNYNPADYPGREMWFWGVTSAGDTNWVRKPLLEDY